VCGALLSSSFNLSPTLKSTRCLIEEKTPVAAAIFSSSHEQSRFEEQQQTNFPTVVVLPI
jgi:hypothetical protein